MAMNHHLILVYSLKDIDRRENMIAYNFKFLKTRNLEEKHNKNNKEIFEKIKNFMVHNNLNPEDFYVGGSSCCSYMNYFILNEVRDVDIFLMKAIDVEKTEGIDIIVSRAITGYKPELVEKDGIYFLSPMDLTIDCAVKAILRRKKQSTIYFKLLLNYMDITVEEFQKHFEKEFEQHVFNFKNKDAAIEAIRNNMYLLQEWGKVTKMPSFIEESIKRGIMHGKIEE